MLRWFGWSALVLVLFVPVWRARHALGATQDGLIVFVSVAAVVGLAVALFALLRMHRSSQLLVLAVVLASVAIRLIFWGLVQFTGAGYTAEVFAHLEWQSVVVAWQEFRVALIGTAIGVVLLAGWLGWLMRRSGAGWPPRNSAGLLLVALFTLGMTRAATPEWQMWQAWRTWSTPVPIRVDDAVLQRWQDTGWVNTRVAPVEQLTASPAAKPKNLVLVYLESIGSAIVEHPRWPGLMPHLQQLVHDHSLVDDVYNSGYVTIEGIVNSQCGSLLPLAGGAGFADGDAVADRLPCLGDVLGRAGYEQVYLGGADLGFAGKGRFLAAHGYNSLKGITHWRSIGLDQRSGDWGLSDADLFEQSLLELESLQAADKPFNLTMLTIGTHVPGFPYAECVPYADGKHVFLDAVHCTDQLLADWLDKAQARGLLRDTVVVITGDHSVFPNPTMQSLFGSAVDDRRLPLVVLSDTPVTALTRVGAGYDLAPTVLDLLDVSHSAEFVLGRSLMRVPARPDYVVRRYSDLQRGVEVESPEACAVSDAPPALPLDRCAKTELLGTLASLARSYTSASTRFSCDSSAQVLIPTDHEAPVSFLIGGLEQFERFSWQGRPLPADADGLFLLFGSGDGEVVKRRYLPAATLADTDALPHWWAEPWPESAQWAVVAWRAPIQTAQGELSRPKLLVDWQADQSGSWLLQAHSTVVAVGSVNAEGAMSLQVSPQQCQHALASP